jgi:hypothetical protein
METIVPQPTIRLGSLSQWSVDQGSTSLRWSLSTAPPDGFYSLNITPVSLPEILSDNKVSWYITLLLFVKSFRNSNFVKPK